MPIERNNNEETSLIIGNNFPTDNEETFASDASNQRAVSQGLRDVQENLAKVKQYIGENMSGATASSYLETLSAQEKRVESAIVDHDNLAAGLEKSANDIAVTKSNLNNVDDTFHKNMDTLRQWGKDNGQYQETMNTERNQLVESAQEQAKTLSSDLSTSTSSTLADVNAGRPIDPSAGMRLAEGAKSSPIIDSRGAGFAPASVASGPVSSSARGSATAGVSSAPQRFSSSQAGTGLSSTSTLSRAGSATGAGSAAGIMPAGVAGTSAQGANNQAPMAGLPMGGMMGAGTMGAMAAGAGTSSPVPGTAGGTTQQQATANAKSMGTAKVGSEINRDSVQTPSMHAWTDSEFNMFRVGLTVWLNLVQSGWPTGVAVARIRAEEKTKIIWTTDFGAAFIPDVLTTSVATPADVTQVDERVLRRMILSPAAAAMNMYLEATGYEVAERVVIDTAGRPEAGFLVVPGDVAIGMDEQAFLNDAAIDSVSLMPASVDQGDVENKAREIVSRVDQSATACLLFAHLSLASQGANPMPDGSSDSPGTYLQKAVADLLSKKFDEGVTQGMANLVWQAELFSLVS